MLHSTLRTNKGADDCTSTVMLELKLVPQSQWGLSRMGGKKQEGREVGRHNQNK